MQKVLVVFFLKKKTALRQLSNRCAFSPIFLPHKAKISFCLPSKTSSLCFNQIDAVFDQFSN